MTTLDGRPNTALLIVDVQVDVVSGAWDRDGVIARINTLVDKARAEQVPVVWVQHSDDNMPSDTDGWQLVPELSPGEAEPLVHKRYGDSFEDTDLESLLSERRVGRVVVAGAQTDACIRSTLHGALVRGYDVTLVEDAHTTEDLASGVSRSRPSRSSPTPTPTGPGRTRRAAQAMSHPRPTSTSPRLTWGRAPSPARPPA